jgi:ligand-binding sensor domain-containing protein/two-component sensor histidine kinase
MTPAWHIWRDTLIGLLVAAVCATAPALEGARSIFQFQHTSWTAKEGAPNAVRALAQTTDGYLWMGGQTGLDRFDGIRFEHYKPPSGQELRSDYVASLMATPDGGLWIGFSSGGADFLKGGRITSYGEPEGFLPGVVFSFAMDQEGTVWAATQTGLARLAGSRWERIGKDWGYPGTGAVALFVDRAGTLWVAPEKSLFFLRRGETIFRIAADHLDSTNDSIAQTRDGTLWLSELSGAPLRNSKTRTVRPVSVRQPENIKTLPQILEIDNVNVSLVDHAGSLWITSTDGIYRVPYPERLGRNRTSRFEGPAFETFTEKNGLSMNRTYPVIEDREGNIWVASDRGLDRFRETNTVPITPMTGPLVVGEEGDAWFPTWDFPEGQLIHLRGLTASSQPLDATPLIASRGRHGVIWMGGREGIWRYTKDRLDRIPVPEGINRLSVFRAIAEDGSGNLWVSIAPKGVFRLKNGAWTRFGGLEDLPKQTARTLLTDSVGRIWFGYDGSEVALLSGDSVRIFSSADGLTVVNVQTIYEHRGHIWIGGEHGLALFMNGRFQSLIADGDAVFSGISGIVETANGDLWLNAIPGIVRIPAPEIRRVMENPANRVHCELFDVLDGLTGTAIQVRPNPTLVASSDGRLWFLTYNGIFQIDPNHLLRNAIPPSVFVRFVDSGGVMYPSEGDGNMPPRTTSVHIEYTSPNLSVPERVHFRYRLDGMDNSWQDAGTRREAFYTNLHPGHYHFSVIASNNDGVWNDVGASVNFSIAPAWFQTTWFRAFCVCIFLLLLCMLYRLRLKQLERQFHVALEARVEERTRIARELHDTLLQSFNALLLRFQAVSNVLPSRPEEAKQRVDRAIEEASNAITEGRDAVNELRSDGLMTIDLAQAISNFGKELLSGATSENPPEFRAQVEGTPRNLDPIVRDEVYRIAAEALRNAIRHANARRIEVEIRYDEQYLRLRIRDDGNGIDLGVLDNDRAPGHWGLHGMRERATLVGGKFEVWSELGSGTEVELNIPATSAYAKPPASRWAIFSGSRRS